MKLNKRLLALASMVKQPYDLVWDCCCDHGLLGFKILADGIVKHVNFVDVVPEIIERLRDKLAVHAHHLPVDTQWNTFCVDVSNIVLEQLHNDPRSIFSLNNTPRQLVIISGVGGELIAEILGKLIQRYHGGNIDYLLCPVHHTYKLRNTLQELNFKLKKEQLVIDNKRGYELLLVNQLEGELLSVTGNQLWEKTEEHQSYLLNLISHYRRVINAKSDCLISRSALSDYQLLYQKIY